MLRAIVLVGAPAAGKDTQTRRLVEDYEWPAIITSQDLVVPTADGRLCPDEEVVLRLRDRSASIPVEQTFILNGMPRTVDQATALGSILHQRYGRDWCQRSLVVEFGVGLEKGWDRICRASDRGNRRDDALEIYTRRYQEYQERLGPLREELDRLGLTVETIDTDPLSSIQVARELARRLAQAMVRADTAPV